MTITEIETIEHLDFDATLGCEWPDPGCDREAECQIQPTCNPDEGAMFCRQHGVEWIEDAAASPYRYFRCAHCTHIFPRPVMEHFHLIPL